MGEFEREINEGWEKQVRGYYEKTNTQTENLLVEGYFKTRFVYRLLSEDLIESLGCNLLSDPAIDDQEKILEEAEELLCLRLESATDTDPALIRRTIRLFIDKGYIKLRQDGKTPIWCWTHNNKID